MATRLALVGGFLGAGKTTALGALTRMLQAQGKRIGIVTNDQAADLVDTAALRESGSPVAEVAGGCFCCRFPDLLGALQSAQAEAPVDILLAEPVGSCTDLWATVIAPLRRYHADAFSVAPFTVLADPDQVRACVLGETSTPLSSEVVYIFRKQLEEADAIALTKVDTLSDEEADRLVEALQARYERPILRLSAVRGDGMDEWLQLITTEEASGVSPRILSEIDYDTYAAGEAALAWLNTSAQLVGQPTFDADIVLTTLASEFQEKCRIAGAEIAHVKALLTSEDGKSRRVHLTTTDAVDIRPLGEALGGVSQGRLVLNARVHTDPETLDRIANEALTISAETVRAEVRAEAQQAFRPGYPRPTYRLPVAA